VDSIRGGKTFLKLLDEDREDVRVEENFVNEGFMGYNILLYHSGFKSYMAARGTGSGLFCKDFLKGKRIVSL
jgi:hypothetical protein